MASAADRRKKYSEVGLEVPFSLQEVVCNYIIENYAGGLILEEEEGSNRAGIKFYLTEFNKSKLIESLTHFINSLDASLDYSGKDIRIKPVPDIEWVEAYRQSLRPIYIGNLVIHPPWIEIDNKESLEIIIEPKMAFGTGLHESTKLSIEAILKYLRPGQSFFDLGSGSGILSILAAKLKAGKIIGVDIDPFAFENGNDNIRLNKVDDKIEIILGSVEIAAEAPPYDFFVVNIIKKTIMELYDRIDRCTSDNGKIVLSGLIDIDEGDISKMLVNYGRPNFEITRDGEWIAYTVFK